jgi:REP element-mobilizing transposase RayT
MPARRKLFQTGTVLELCTRIHSGLPLTAHPSAQTLIKGLLARAQELNPVTISHVIFMSNHFHMIVVVEKPEDICGFMEYVKGQSSRVLGTLFGLTGQCWAERYDSPRILDSQKLMERLVYLYTNPQRANLVDTIDHYPNLSTWDLLKTGTLVSKAGVVKHSIKCLSTLVANAKRYFAKYPRLPDFRPNVELVLDTAAAFRVLGIEDDEEVRECFSAVIAKVRAQEKELINHRKESGIAVIGKAALIDASPLKDHKPKKCQPRMLCLASCSKTRASFIQWYKSLDAACREVYELWCQGIKAAFPTIGFPPRDPFCIRCEGVP